jgi:hypothetical protein
MKKTSLSPLFYVDFFSTGSFAQGLSYILKLAETTENMQQASWKNYRTKQFFYNFGNLQSVRNKRFTKLVNFYRTDLKNTVVSYRQRSAAAVFKVGLVEKNGKVTMSYTNPEYIFKSLFGRQLPL